MKGIQVAVTGASGFVGNNLCRILLENGYKVKAIYHKRNPMPALAEMDLQLCKADVRDPASLRQAFQDCKIIFHTAGIVDITSDRQNKTFPVNVQGVRNVVQTALQIKDVRLVHFSSIHAIDHDENTVGVDETLPLAYQSEIPYNRSKALGQCEVNIAIAQGLDAIIINPTAIIGPYDFRPTFMGQVVRYTYKGWFPFSLSSGFDWVDVRDVCMAAISAAEKGRRGSSYIVSGEWKSFSHLAQLIANWRQRNFVPPRVPLWTAYLGLPLFYLIACLTRKQPLYTTVALRMLRESNRHISNQKARKELGFQPRSLEKTIADQCAWLQEQEGLLSKS